MLEYEQSLTPDMLRSQLEIEIFSISSERVILDILTRGNRLAFIVMDRTRIILGGSNLHTPLEQALGINEHQDLYIKGAAQIEKKQLRVDYTSDTFDGPKKFRQMYGVSGDEYLDYSAEIEIKAMEYLQNLIKRKKRLSL